MPTFAASVAAVHHFTLTGLGTVVVGVASVLTAIGGLWKLAHLGELLRGTREFLRTWNGEPARPGFEERPSVPERLARTEAAVLDNGEQSRKLTADFGRIDRRTEEINHLFRGEVTSRLTLLGEGVEELKTRGSQNHDSLNRLEGRVDGIDQRITDHRRRNEEQIEALRVEIERRIAEAQKQTGEVYTRSEVMRAALHELGMSAEPLSRPPEQ